MVADIGAGAGWFTIRLAKRVGPNGLVYAQDVQHEMVTAIRRRVQREKLQNVRVVQGTKTHITCRRRRSRRSTPCSSSMCIRRWSRSDRVTFLQSLAALLRPKGRIGIVNYKPGSGGPGPDRASRAPAWNAMRVRRSCVLSPPTELRYQYLIVLGLDPRPPGDTK